MAESLRADPKVKNDGEKTTATLVFREFAGINTQSPRESIADEQFAWLENAMPIGSGNLPVLYQRGSPVGTFDTGITAPPIYLGQVSYSGNDYLVALFAGHGLYEMNLVTGVVTKIANNGVFTAQMQVTQWDNQGILIVDPSAGYYDWNVTAANTLTQITGGSIGTVGSISITAPGANYTSPPAVALTGGGGSGATAYATLGGNSANVVFGGGGAYDSETHKVVGFQYTVGQIITLVGGSWTNPLTAQVTGISSNDQDSGIITSIVLQNAGAYSSIPTGNIPVSPGNAQLTVNWLVSGAVISNGGSGYSSAPGVAFSGGGGSGAMGNSTLGNVAGGQIGNSIATYAGRVWIGSGRTVTFTDIAKYNSFGGAGGSLTISDSTLHKSVTSLFTSNGYLYIFGDDSIDILSNVQVVGGSTQFSRVNLTTSVGSTFPTSTFSYLRSIAFANNTGFYALSGSTPEKMSSPLDGLLPFIDLSKPIYGSPIELNGILCAAFSFFFTDTFTLQFPGQYRSVIAVYFNNKWFIASQTQTSQAVLSAPINGVYTSFVVDTNGSCYPCFSSSSSAQAIIQTKLWDFGEPIMDKQALRVGLGAIFPNQGITSCTVDTEYSSYPANLSITNQFQVIWINNSLQQVIWENNSLIEVGWGRVNFPSYQLIQGTVNAANGKYLGISLVMDSPATMASFAIEYKTGARW